LDEICVLPGKSATGKKHLLPNEWFFDMHFPGNPVMPGVLQMEAIMQTGGLIVNTLEGEKKLSLMFLDAQMVKIKKSAKPNDILTTSVEMKEFKRGIASFEGKAFVNDELSCEIKFRLVAPSELVKVGEING
jgi:3-hydroxyacyl-[acyl-carrier-protein] dehydratase